MLQVLCLKGGELTCNVSKQSEHPDVQSDHLASRIEPWAFKPGWSFSMMKVETH